MRTHTFRTIAASLLVGSLVAVIPHAESALKLKLPIPNIFKLPVEIINDVVRGRPDQAFNHVTDTVKKVGETVRQVVKNPRILVEYAVLAARCAPTAARLASQDPTAIRDAANDLASAGPCYQFVAKCNADTGDLFCPDVQSVRQQLRRLCGKTDPLRTALSTLGKANPQSAVSQVNDFCNKTDPGDSRIAETDEAFGQGVRADGVQVAGLAGAELTSEAVKLSMEMAQRLAHQQQLSEKQMAIIDTMAKSQADTIKQLLNSNDEQRKQFFELVNKQLEIIKDLQGRYAALSHRAIDAQLEQARIAKDMVTTLSNNHTDVLKQILEAHRIELKLRDEIFQKTLAQTNAIMAQYKNDKAEAERQLAAYILALKVELSERYECHARVMRVNREAAFCSVFPQAVGCDKPAEIQLCGR